MSISDVNSKMKPLGAYGGEGQIDLGCCYFLFLKLPPKASSTTKQKNKKLDCHISLRICDRHFQQVPIVLLWGLPNPVSMGEKYSRTSKTCHPFDFPLPCIFSFFCRGTMPLTSWPFTQLPSPRRTRKSNKQKKLVMPDVEKMMSQSHPPVLCVWEETHDDTPELKKRLGKGLCPSNSLDSKLLLPLE